VRQSDFAHRLGRVPERFLGIRRFQIGTGLQNLSLRHSIGDHAHHSCHRNPQAPNAGHTVHLLRINGSSCESHGYPSVLAFCRPSFAAAEVSLCRWL
jgi:hypothetical protein